MSERVTVQGKIGRSARTNPLGEGIDPYQSIGLTLRSGTGIVISQRAPAIGPGLTITQSIEMVVEMCATRPTGDLVSTENPA